jgi:hypothetical protein
MDIMKKTLLVLAVAAIAQGYAMQASATTLTLDSLAHAGEDAASAGWSYVEDGFQLSNIGANEFAVWGTDSLFYTGSTALMNDNDGGETTLRQIGNSAFALYSIDLAAMYPGFTEDGVDVTFGGMKTDGTLVTQIFHVADGAPQTFSFSGFTDLAYVGWTNDAMYHQFDNINVAAVPEPETYAMVLTGLGLLGFMARRRAVR